MRLRKVTAKDDATPYYFIMLNKYNLLSLEKFLNKNKMFAKCNDTKDKITLKSNPNFHDVSQEEEVTFGYGDYLAPW